jgi:hypothetical protein
MTTYTQIPRDEAACRMALGTDIYMNYKGYDIAQMVQIDAMPPYRFGSGFHQGQMFFIKDSK